MLARRMLLMRRRNKGRQVLRQATLWLDARDSRQGLSVFQSVSAESTLWLDAQLSAVK